VEGERRREKEEKREGPPPPEIPGSAPENEFETAVVFQFHFVVRTVLVADGVYIGQAISMPNC